MKAKLGKLDAVNATNYGSYKALFKKKVKEISEDPKTNGICDYVLVSGAYLSWNGASESETQPLLFLGQKTSWIKEIKASKTMNLKAYSYGTCKLVKVGSDVEIALCPEKGKLTQDTLLKPLKKIFKSFKPKTYLEVVADLNEVESSTTGGVEEDASGLSLLKSIGGDLLKYHLAIEKIKKAIAATTTEDEKRSLLVKQNEVLKRLKHLCASWTTDIAPQAAELIKDKESETWEKIYQKWSSFFEKRKAAKEGNSSDEDAIKAEEENIYTKAVKDLKAFYDNLRKGELIDPSVIETNIENLEEHLDKWKAFVNNKKPFFPNELKVLEGKLKKIKTDWSLLKPLIKSYFVKKEALDKVLDSGDTKLIRSLFKELESINNEIVNVN